MGIVMFTKEEIEKIHQLMNASVKNIRPFGKWSEDFQAVFYKVGIEHCFVYSINGQWETPEKRRFYVNLCYIINPEYRFCSQTDVSKSKFVVTDYVSFSVCCFRGQLGIYRPIKLHMEKACAFLSLSMLVDLPCFNRFYIKIPPDPEPVDLPIVDVASNFRNDVEVFCELRKLICPYAESDDHLKKHFGYLYNI